MPKRYSAADIALTDEERKLAKTAQGAAGEGTAWGSGAGSLIGGALGTLGFIGSPALAAVTIPAGAAIGGALGGAGGGTWGGAIGNDAEKKLSAAEKRRALIIEKAKARQAALDALLGEA